MNNHLLTLPASSHEHLFNGTVSVRPSVCLSVPSIDSSSDAACRSPEPAASLSGSGAAASGQRQCCDPRKIDADLSIHKYNTIQ